MKPGQGFPCFFSDLGLRESFRIRRPRDVDLHARFFENLILGSAADGDSKRKVFLEGSRRFRNYDRRRDQRFAGRVLERKPGLGSVWSELPPPRAISIEALGEFASPGSVLLRRMRDDRGLLGTIGSGAARIRVHGKTLACGTIRGNFPDRRTDGKG